MEQTDKELVLSGNELVVLRNGFVEIDGQELSLLGWHFFFTFISKLNTSEPVERASGIVEFPVDEFNALLGNGRPNITFLKEAATGVTKYVNIPLAHGGFKRVPLFSECTVYLNSKNVWTIKMVAERTMLPYFYGISEEFFEFRLHYCLALNSINREKLYMILKRFQGLGSCEIDISRLRVILGIKPDEYSGKDGWRNFKVRVLDACQKAMKEKTDIYYEYQCGRKTPRGAWLSVIFTIKENRQVIRKSEAVLTEKSEILPESYSEQVADLIAICEKNLSRKLIGVEKDCVKTWVELLGFDKDVMQAAFKDNLYRGANLSLKNINDTLTRWHDKGIKTIEDAKKLCDEEQSVNRRRSRRNNATQGSAWRTGEEAGVRCPPVDITKDSSEEPDVQNEDIPEDILSMFGD
ncbi:MAG: RepB family plasmid replication initiator protein [Lachnospiraceae bacterium]|nr:RepB family plasmid replication initiator protein [Lachnospiraceae bacterium]